MPVIASILAAIIPMIIYTVIIWRIDKYEREPFTNVILHFFWGAVGAIFLAIIGSLILSGFLSIIIDDSSFMELTSTVFVAPFIEEITKGILLILTVNAKRLDNVTDGMVYGGAIGLGFGMTENAFYFIGYGTSISSWIMIVFIRTIFSAVMHGIATGILGAFLATAKFSKSYRATKLLPIIGLLAAMLIHFLWNFSVSFDNTFIYGFLFMFVLIVLFFFIMKKSLNKENKIIREELTEEANDRVIPIEHIEILCSGDRKNSGWIAEEIRTEYINSAIKLAFRKAQSKSTFGKRKTFYEKEVVDYRNMISEILLKASQIKI